MKSKVTKIISVFLCSCFVLTACFQLIIGVKNLGHNPFQFMPVGSISSQYNSYGKAYDFADFKLSKNSKSTTEVANEVDENTVMDYTTSLKDLPDSNVNIKVHERIDSMGNLVDVITVDGIVYGEITYNAKGLVVSNALNYNDVFYEYDDELVTNLSLNGIEYDYGYVDGKLSNIYLDDDIFSSFEYSNYGKINKETHYYFDRLFEHTNVATIESSYNYESDTKIIAKIYDYVNDTPYQIVKADKVIENQVYNVVTSITYNGKTVNFDYNYAYNGVPFITQVTNDDETYYLSYINDKIVSKTKENEITTYVYSSCGNIIGSIVGKNINDKFVSMYVSYVSDGFGNIIESNYLDVKSKDTQVTLEVKKIVEQRFDSLGHTIYKNSFYDLGLDFGYNGAFTFDSLNIFYKDGNLYSSSLADYVYQPNKQDNFTRREFLTNSNRKQNPTLSSVQKSVVTESLQNEIETTLDTSSLAGVKLVSGETHIATADVFTLPVAIDNNNLLKTPSKVAFVVNLQNNKEVEYFKDLLKEYYTYPSQIYAVMDDYYLTSLLENELTYQFIFNHKLFTVQYVQDGLYGYTVKDNFSKRDYLKSVNIINYDTGRYVTYHNSVIDTDDYISGMSFITNFSSTEELDDFFEQLGYINTSIGETYQNINFGDNSSFVKNLLKNTSNLNLPEYDSSKQYISVDDLGNYVINDIPTDAKAEDDPRNADYRKIKAGISKILSSIMFISTGIFLMTSCGPFAVICGVITLISGVTVTVCGIAQMVEGITGESWIVNNLLGGKSELLDTIASIASTIATISSIVGSLTYKACFVEDTQIQTTEGYKNIQDIKVGDYVLSYNTETGVQEYNKVLDTYSRKVDKLCQVTVGGQAIVSSLNHPYYVNGKWVEASELNVGDKVLLNDFTTKAVESVKIIDSEDTTVYNINVDEAHTYYAEDVLVHNSCASDQFTSKETDELFNSPEYTSTRDYFKQKYPDIDFADKKIAGKFWNSHRREFNKMLGEKLRSNPAWRDRIKNLEQMLRKGTNPRIISSTGDILRIQYHHYYGKLGGNMFNIYPMIQQKHMLFHNIYGRNDPSKWTELAEHIVSLLR